MRTRWGWLALAAGTWLAAVAAAQPAIDPNIAAAIADASRPPLDRFRDLEALRQHVKTLQQANTWLDLELQDEIERSTIQLFLTRQEITAAKREAAAVRTQCGPPCVAVPQ